MDQQATYVGWDFMDTWTIIEAQTYPHLPWLPEIPWSPRGELQTLIETVEELAGHGEIGHGIANSLVNQVLNALKKIEQHNMTAACNTLQAFINHVCDLVREGQLSEGVGADLLSQAEAIMTTIGCGDIRGCE